MAKIKVEKVITKVKVEFNLKEELKKLLIQKVPALFDRTPEITGDINKLVDEIISLIK